jgi:hypothetical protein
VRFLTFVFDVFLNYFFFFWWFFSTNAVYAPVKGIVVILN